MLSIKVSNKSLDVPNDISITLKFMSPLFNAIGDHSYPFKLPATSRNKIILNWKNRIENVFDKYEFFLASVLWDGIQLFSGTLRVSKASEVYESVLYVDKGNFNWEIKNRMLHELNLGTIPFTNTTEAMAYYESTLSKVYPEASIAFPEIKNEVFFTPPATAPELWYYNFTHSSGPVLWALTQGGQPSLLVPFIYLRWLLAKIASLLDYTLQDDFFSKTEELNNLLVYNSNDQSEYEMYSGTIVYQHHVPRIKVNEFFIGLENYFNCRFFVNNLTKTITIKGATDVLNSSETIPFSNGVSNLTVLIPNKVPGMRFSMKPDNGDSVFQGIVDAEQKISDRIKGSVSTVSDLANPPYCFFISMEDIWWVEDVGNWYVPSTDMYGNLIWIVSVDIPSLMTFFPYKIQIDSTVKIESCFSTLVHAGYVLCGNLQTAMKEITPRLFFVQIEDHIVTAKCHNDNFSLLFYSEKGIFSTFWKDYANWYMTQRTSVQFTKDLTILDIVNLDFSTKYSINDNNFLLSEVQFTLTNNSIQPATITAFSCF